MILGTYTNSTNPFLQTRTASVHETMRTRSKSKVEGRSVDSVRLVALEELVSIDKTKGDENNWVLLIACGENILELGIRYEKDQEFGRVYHTIHMTEPHLEVVSATELRIGYLAKDTSMDEVIATLFNTALDKYRMVEGGLGVRWWCYKVLKQLGDDGVLTISSRFIAWETLKRVYLVNDAPYTTDVKRGDFVGRPETRGPTPESEEE